eukprot:CAMPEP_0115866608 /NCGR_PEP_ID=MMETSP0287-20121206/20337_1 /TAXON_ID=412157 /ORGANISM="Chrysochromulina rotalis, Strain UIO044" /LENGTH=69 /DNA_ID=CAMNT_0003321181 /DNA_START=75 /DNA_END=284 /DNA_ORIENTATION=-
MATEGTGALGWLDAMLPEQSPNAPMTSLIMLYLVIALILGESAFMLYQWFDKKFGDEIEHEDISDKEAR